MLHYLALFLAVATAFEPNPEKHFRGLGRMRIAFSNSKKQPVGATPTFPSEFICEFLEFTEDAQYGNHSMVGIYDYSERLNASRNERIYLYTEGDPTSALGEFQIVLGNEKMLYRAAEYDYNPDSQFECRYQTITNFTGPAFKDVSFVKTAIVYPNVRDTLLLSAQWGPRACDIYFAYSEVYNGYVYVGYDSFTQLPIIEYGDINGFYFQRVYARFRDGTPSTADFVKPDTWQCEPQDAPRAKGKAKGKRGPCHKKHIANKRFLIDRLFGRL